MGKIIEKIAHDRKHEIILKIDQDNQHELTAENLQQADVAIEFSTPHTVLANIEQCLNAGVPVVVGTTGWYSNLPVLMFQMYQNANERKQKEKYMCNISESSYQIQAMSHHLCCVMTAIIFTRRYQMFIVNRII